MRSLHPRIPFIVGNLGADAIRDASNGKPLRPDPLAGRFMRYRDLGFAAVEDYIGWNVVEPQEGVFDFSMHLGHREAARRAGLKYIAYPWMHALPAWMTDPPRFEPFRCLEHDAPTCAPSIFHPATRELHDRFLERIGSELGRDLDQLTLAAPCEYGEVGYPSGMIGWFLCHPPHLEHAHEGWWCGDTAARARFRDEFLAHGDLDRSNREFGTAFLDEEDVRPLAPDGRGPTAAYRAWFSAWYRRALLEFMSGSLAAAEALFAGVPLGVKVGYGSEQGAYGQDYTGLARLLKRRGGRRHRLWSTYGSLPVVHHKRIQTICRTLDVPYCTEGVTERSREDVLNRLFEDAADGARSFFEFHHTFDAQEEAFLAGAPFLRGEDPIIDVALLFHSSQHAERPRQPFPPGLQALSEPLRDLLDYEVVDEELLAEPAALERHGVLVLPDPHPLATASVAAIRAFAERGGIVVAPAHGQPGPEDAWLDPLLGAPPPATPPAARTLAFDGDPAPRLLLDYGPGHEWLLFGRHHGVDSVRKFFGGERDDPCRWLGGDAGFRLPIDPGGDWSLELELFLDPRARPAEWRVLVHDHPVATLSGSGVVSLAIRLERPLLAGRPVLSVRLAGPTFRPASLGENDDDRDLGVVLGRVALERAGSAHLAMEPLSWRSLRATARTEILKDECFVPLGAGGVLLAPALDLAALAAFTLAASAERSRIVAGAEDHWQPDGRLDPVRMARFADRLLLFNRGPKPQRRTIQLPGPRTISAYLEPLQLREIPLR